ncbi:MULTISPECIES: acylase [unclassified Sinorhizobium]|uniref:acylase n=1 Tax=unclassified Sinorhizobium TaxID=2613772 RepID=UPI0035246C85
MTKRQLRPVAFKWVSLLLRSALMVALVPVHLAYAGGEKARAIDVQITRTTFGIPHIRASDFRSLGYGVAYAYAQDNLCLIAEMLVTVRGQRSRYFGAEGRPSWGGPANLASDAFYRSYLEPDQISRLYAGISQDAAELVAGYAAGYNRYLSDTPSPSRPTSCRNSDWVTPATENDILLLMADKMIEGSVASLKEEITAAVPPPAGAGSLEASPASSGEAEPSPPGSNGYALGRDVVAGGTGILVANPHFPWDGPDRFYEMHLTIPGQLDVMGASILPFPAILIGFNKDVAWTHTVSTGQRRTFYELTLHPDDVMSYFYGGQPEKIRTKQVPIDVLLPDGTIQTVMRTTYWSRFGPIIQDADGGLTWDRKHAYAVRDAMLENSRALDQWLGIDGARSIAELRAALVRLHGTPWVNTIAADRFGNTLYADMSIVPNISEKQYSSCRPSEKARQTAARFNRVVLDGSQAACDWETVEGSPQPGIVPAERMPVLERGDYVLNSNDSYWLANAEHPLTDYPPIIGGVNEQQNLRTRMGYLQLRELISEKKGRLETTDLRQMLLRDRNYAAEMVLDDIDHLCDDAAPVAAPSALIGCAALRRWDRRDDASSQGAVLFRELWRRVSGLSQLDLWRYPFDPSNPLTTPRGIAWEKSDVRDALLQAIADTVDELQRMGFEVDVPLGVTQARPSAIGRIPLNGGTGAEGVLNLMALGPLGSQGYSTQLMGGSSYIQVVSWDQDGPVALALLTYGQSSDRNSPHYADQTVTFLAKILPRRPFTDAEIQRDQLSVIKLVE